MKSVQIVVDNIRYTLDETPTGDWTITNRAPLVGGEYPVGVFVITDSGKIVEADVTDPDIQSALVLIVQETASISGERLLQYYPQVIQKILEFQALTYVEGFEIDELNLNVDNAINDAYLTTMGESRINEWEKELGLTYSPEDSLDDRRDAIIARIRGQGKLNTALINAIVSAFTGGTAISYIENSTLYVKITPPPTSKQYKFDNVVRELEQKVPAHLNLVVTRNYATWGEVKENYTDWNAINQLTNWEDLMLWIAPQ